MGKKKAVGPGYALEKFAANGWPQDLEGIKAIISPLSEVFGEPNIGSKRYPDIRPTIKQWEAWGKRWPGHQWYFEFPNGQTLSVVISTNDGRVIERSYSDRGDIHLEDVFRMLRGWQKTIRQQVGRKRDAETQDYFRRWEASGFDNRIRRELRAEYASKHPGEQGTAARFDRYMRRYRQERTKLPKRF